MASPKLYVVFYRPRHGNYHHWALYVEHQDVKMIFEVTGEHPNFKRNVLQARPEQSKNFLGKEYVGIIQKEDIEKIKTVASTIHVDNETVQWDCQDYVLEILDQLEEDYILEENDEDYREARSILKAKRGAIV